MSLFQNKRASLLSLILFIVSITVLVLFFFFNNGSESYFSNDNNVDTKTDSVYCYSSTLVEPFFNSMQATSVIHEIKIIFEDGLASKATYALKADYPAAIEAKEAESRLHAKYNIYMGSDNDKLSPTFSVVEGRLSIVLYGRVSDFDKKASDLFYLSGLSDALTTYPIEKYIEEYEQNGFKCSINNI